MDSLLPATILKVELLIGFSFYRILLKGTRNPQKTGILKFFYGNRPPKENFAKKIVETLKEGILLQNNKESVTQVNKLTSQFLVKHNLAQSVAVFASILSAKIGDRLSASEFPLRTSIRFVQSKITSSVLTML